MYQKSNFYLTQPTCTAQQPRMSISSTSSGVPMAGEDYSLRCGVMILEDLLSTIQIYWINPSGKLYKQKKSCIEYTCVL